MWNHVIRDFSGYFGKWHFLSVWEFFIDKKSNFGKITLCSYSINIDVMLLSVFFILFITTLRTSIQSQGLAPGQ